MGETNTSTLKPPPSKRAKKTESNNDDDDDPMSVEDGDDGDTNGNNKGGNYELLPGYGEHKRAVSSVKFAPTRLTKKSALCASSSADGVIKLWDLADCCASDNDAAASATSSFAVEPKVTCSGHSRGINEICWNPVSPLLASASDDKTVRFLFFIFY